MDFALGDFVRFLNEREEGTVTAIYSKISVGVTIRGELEVPVAINEIVKITPAAAIEPLMAVVAPLPTVPRVIETEPPLDRETLALRLKARFFKEKPDALVLLAPPLEVELHTEFLAGWHGDMNGTETLKLQLQTFTKNLDAAIADNMEKIVFIHGVGNGVLRKEIQKKLSRNPHIRYFKNAGKDQFGYGATEVIFR